MKKITFSILVVLVLVLAACSPSEEVQQIAPVMSDFVVEEISADSSQASPNEPISQGAGNCANEFFPLNANKTWRYAITSNNEVTEYSMTFKNIDDNSFTVVQAFPDLSTETTWNCSEEGMLSSSFVNMTLASNADVSFDTVEISGISLLPESQWQIGKSWPMGYKVSVTMKIEGAELSGEGEITIDRTITAVESVSVPSGTYSDAYRVDSSGQMSVAAMGSVFSIPLVYSDWYVRGVGLVKSVSSDPNTAFSIELIAIE